MRHGIDITLYHKTDVAHKPFCRVRCAWTFFLLQAKEEHHAPIPLSAAAPSISWIKRELSGWSWSRFPSKLEHIDASAVSRLLDHIIQMIQSWRTRTGLLSRRVGLNNCLLLCEQPRYVNHNKGRQKSNTLLEITVFICTRWRGAICEGEICTHISIS